MAALRTSRAGRAGGAPALYFDNNATTMCPPGVIDTVAAWMNRGNPSAEYASAREARKMMGAFRRALADECGFGPDGPRGYQTVFTSGGSEGNSHVVTAAARAYATKTGKMPHIITSAAEHKSVLVCCLQLARDQLAQLSVVPVQTEGAGAGTVDPEEVRRALRPNTCLVTIMAANNETGAVNDLSALGEVAHAARVPFHSDAVQLFGKSAVRPHDLNLDAFTASFHKLHGPPGVGLLVLRNDFVSGYGLGGLICGTQNEGLRGGTENLPGIAGAFAAFRLVVPGRGEKNDRIRRLRNGVQGALAKKFPALHLDDYREARPRVPDGNALTPRRARVAGEPQTKRGRALAGRLDAAASAGTPAIVWIGPSDRARTLPGTIFLAVARAGFCNRRARAALEDRGVIVGVGSACAASENRVSHVLEAMDVPPELRQGVLRISLGDETTLADATGFLRHFCEIITSDEVLVDADASGRPAQI